MKTQKIVAPEGYEIDRENSTIDEIVFKEIKKALPKTWEEFGKISGYHVRLDTNVEFNANLPTLNNNRNIFVASEQAAASIALAQLSQLRDVYRNGWIPNWNHDSSKYCIVQYKEGFEIVRLTNVGRFLSFENREIAQEFLNNFRDLIEQAKPLMS